MDAVPNMLVGLVLGAAGWWMLDFRRRAMAWAGAACIVAAVYFLATGTVALLGRPVALSVITAGAAMAASAALNDID